MLPCSSIKDSHEMSLKPSRKPVKQRFKIPGYIRNNPYISNPLDYETKCTKCHQQFTLNNLKLFGIVCCPWCGHHNLLEPAPSGHRFIRHSPCGHVKLVEELEEVKDCRTCSDILSAEYTVETSFLRPKLKKLKDRESVKAMWKEIKRNPHRVFPELFDCKCVWDGCLKFFSPHDCDGGVARCSHCFRAVPIEFGRPGYSWVFYNRCSHIQQVPTGAIPRACAACGLESAARPSGISAPRRKQLSTVELPNLPL